MGLTTQPAGALPRMGRRPRPYGRPCLHVRAPV